MKNKLYKIFIIIIVNLVFFQYVYSEEINFEAKIIEFLDKDKKIIAKNNVKILTDNEIITANEMVYLKNDGIAEVKGNIILKRLDNNLIIYSDKIIYKKKTEEIIIDENVLMNFNSKFELNTNNAKYNRLENKIILNNNSTIIQY